MKNKIIRVYIINQQGKRSCIKLNKIIPDIETYRKTIRQQLNAQMVLFYIQEISD